MKAFHNDKNIKKKYLDRVVAHRKSDEIIKGQYWKENRNGEFKGCAVGCTIHGSDHTAYERELGIPTWLAKLEDRLFEGMSDDKSVTWPEKFLKAIKPGVDLKKIKGPFLCFVLKSTLDKFYHKKYPKVLAAVNKVIDLYESGETGKKKFAAAYAAAGAGAADAAYAADAGAGAADAAYAAAAAAAAGAGGSAGAGAAADAGAGAADAYAAAAAAAGAAARHSARTNAFDTYADYLLKLLKECR